MKYSQWQWVLATLPIISGFCVAVYFISEALTKKVGGRMKIQIVSWLLLYFGAIVNESAPTLIRALALAVFCASVSRLLKTA